MFVYTATHAAPHPSAPDTHSTLVSPTRIASGSVAEGLAQGRPRVLRIREHVLTYPAVSADPVAAVDEVKRYYADCARCHLSERRTKIVFVKGNVRAGVVAIGEGPGRDEDLSGIPFVGRSGRLQDELFREAGIDPQEDVAWINLSGCRPCDTRFAGDRAPSLVEKAACSERTLMLLRALRPRIVLCLGEVAAGAFWAQSEEPPPNTWATFPAPDPQNNVEIGVVRHPAYMLRVIAAAPSYHEYAASRLFYRRLAARIRAGVPKVAAWPFGLRYLSQVNAPLIGE